MPFAMPGSTPPGSTPARRPRLGRVSHRVLASLLLGSAVALPSAAGLAQSPAPPAAQQQKPDPNTQATPAAQAAPAAQGTTPLPPISVQAKPADSYQVDRVSSPKRTQPIRDTPQSITVVPRQVLDEQGATTLRDALRNVPGIAIQAGEGGGPQGDNLRIRGFAANNDMFVDGMRDTAQYNRETFNIEAVEVTKGPGSAYSGRGSSGGTINLVTKTPTADSFQAGTATIGTDMTKRVTADLNQSLAEYGMAGAALRLNVMIHDSEVAGRDEIEHQRWGVAPSLALGLGTPTRFTAAYQHFESEDTPDYGLPVLDGGAPPVSYSNWYGYKGINTEEVTADVATLKLEHDLNDWITLRNQARFSTVSRTAIVTPPRSADATTDSVTINPTGRDGSTDTYADQFDVLASFATGALEHNLVTGLEVGRESYENQGTNRSGGPFTDSLFNPDPNKPLPGTLTPGTTTETTANTFAVYAFDTVEIGKQFEVGGGLRWDRFDAETDSTAGTSFSQVDDMLSWRIGGVYKPLSYGSVYVAYGTSFNPSAEALSLSANTAGLDPEETETYEVGTKWDLFDERVSVTAAIFRIEKSNARTPGVLPSDPPQVLDGVERVDGFELSVAGSITDDWRVFAGYAYLDGEIIESNNAAEVGKVPAHTPKNTFNIWTTYELPHGFQIGGGAQFVDSRYGNDTNTTKVDSYWLFDAMAAYHLTETVDLRLNVYNLLDEQYIDRVHPGHLVPGAGRTALLTVSAKF